MTQSSSRASLVRELLVGSAAVLTSRLDALDAVALHLLTQGPLDAARRNDAARTAHQLISLAAFGVAAGADLAVKAEAVLRATPGQAAEEGATLADLTERMRTTLDEALAEPGPDATPAPAAPAPAPTGAAPDILLVEDDIVLVQLLERALTGAGWNVAAVSDGPAALEALDVPPHQRPRLVLLDIDLPALDGFGVLRALRERGVLPDVQVLCLTARASEPDVLAVLSLGAVDHVAKPFSLPVLLARVSRAIGRP